MNWTGPEIEASNKQQTLSLAKTQARSTACSTQVLSALGVEENSASLNWSDPSIYLRGFHCCCCLVAKPCPTLCDPMDCSPPAPLFMRFPRQEYWTGLLFPSPGDLPHPGTEPACPTLAGGFFTTEPPGKPCGFHMGPLSVGPCLPGWEEQVTLGTPREVGIYLWSNFWFQDKGAFAFS